jgi:hypothetical protein
LLGEGRNGCDFGSVEIFLDPAEGDEALKHGEKGFGEGVEGEFELIEDYMGGRKLWIFWGINEHIPLIWGWSEYERRERGNGETCSPT